jgi:hypothetical protein
VADSLVGALEPVGVRQIFGLIGDSLDALGDAVRRSQSAPAAAGQAKPSLAGGSACAAGPPRPAARISFHGRVTRRLTRAPDGAG